MCISVYVQNQIYAFTKPNYHLVFKWTITVCLPLQLIGLEPRAKIFIFMSQSLKHLLKIFILKNILLLMLIPVYSTDHWKSVIKHFSFTLLFLSACKIQSQKVLSGLLVQFQNPKEFGSWEISLSFCWNKQVEVLC